MNCYNSERFLEDAIQSIYAQRYQSWEIIFWDNRSTDRSADIARGFDSRLRYFLAEEQTPLGAARQLAVQQARGDFIAFLDTDDLYLPEALATLVDAIGDEYALCYAGIVQIDEEGRETGRRVPPGRAGDLLDPLLRQFDIYLQATLLRRSALERTGLSFDPRITASEEYCLFMQIAAQCPFRSLSQALAKYRVHDDALTNKAIDKWADEREYTLDRIVGAHPGIARRYPGGFKEAYARARYYRARWHLQQGRKLEAVRELAKTVFVSLRYAGLFVLSLLPTKVWNEVHYVRTHRSRFG